MKKILITGANSYIGTSVEKYLAKWPLEYRVDTIDMVDGSWREKSFAGYDSVLHVAGIAHIITKKLDDQARERYWKVNALLPVEVANKAKTENVGQFIFLSSMSVYGEHGSIKNPVVITRETKPAPKDIYGESKLKAEEGILPLDDEGFHVCVLRPPMIYGPRCKGNYPMLVKAALKLPFFPDIQNERSMLFIDNLCCFVKGAVDINLSGIHFPKNKEDVCTSEMVKHIAQVHGRQMRMTNMFNLPLRLLSGKVGVVAKVFGSLVIDQSLNEFTQSCSIISLTESIHKTEMDPGTNTV